MDSWRKFADVDPDLPPHLLPEPWPRQEARETFLDIHTALGSLAQARLVEVATPHWPEASSWITHFQASRNPSRPEPNGGTAALPAARPARAGQTLTLFVAQ